MTFITLTASTGNRNATVWRPSVRLSVPFSLIKRAVHTQRQGATRDMASVHFRPSLNITRTDILAVNNTTKK